MRRLCLLCGVLWGWPHRGSSATSLVECLIAPYEAITSVVCSVRKETKSEVGTVRTLSRVYFQRPDKLHVENVSPVRRRIVADGRIFYSYVEGDPKGFSRPIEQLDQEMLFQLRKVPGTAMDHLFRLRQSTEVFIAPTSEFPTRARYAHEQKWVVLSVDATGRLVKIEFYENENLTKKIAEYNYSDFKEVLPGVYIPQCHDAWLESFGVTTRETSHIDNLSVNGPIVDNLFVPGRFFKGVRFVDHFDQIYK